MIPVSYLVENIVGKGENGGYQQFPFYHNVSKGVFLRVVNSRDCVAES